MHIAGLTLLLASQAAAPLAPLPVVLSEVNVVAYGVGVPLRCSERGLSVRLATEATVIAAGLRFDTANRWTEVTPAVRECVRRDGFEGAPAVAPPVLPLP